MSWRSLWHWPGVKYCGMDSGRLWIRLSEKVGCHWCGLESKPFVSEIYPNVFDEWTPDQGLITTLTSLDTPWDDPRNQSAETINVC